MGSRLTRLLSLVVGVAMIALFGLVSAGTATAAPPPGTGGGNQNTVQVRGTGPNGEQFNGKFTLTKTQQGPAVNPGSPDAASQLTPAPGLAAVGQLTGVLTSPGQGQTIPGAQGPGAQQVNQQIQMPINALQATCQVLNLTLGPLHLNLLGLGIDLNQVVLNITANPAGGLLGQLLCDLAGPGVIGGPLDAIIGLLNQILAAL